MNRNSWIYGGLLIGLFLLACFLYLIRPVVIPFILALLLAYFLDPAADILERRGMPRSVAVALVFAAFLLVAGSVLVFLVPAVKQEILLVKKDLPEYARRLTDLLPASLLDRLGITKGQDLESLFNRAMEGVRHLSTDVLRQMLLFLSRAFTSTFSFLLAVLGYLIIPIYLFYLLRDFDRIKDGMLNMIPPRHRQDVVEVAGEIDAVLGGFIRGQLLVCLVLAVLYSVGLMLIGIDLALLIGILSGAAFVIPYLGTILGTVVAGLMAVAKFHDLLHPALVVGWFCLVQALEGTVITPRLVGDRVGLHPVGTILAVLVGGELFGFLGLLLAVPVTASGNVLLRHFLARYRKSDFFDSATGGEEG